MNTTRQLLTPGKIAVRIGAPLHRVVYVLRTRPHIRPSAISGSIRVYDREAESMIRHELSAIDARRCRKRELVA